MIAAVLGAAALAAATVPAMSVANVRNNLHALDGKTVVVHGWLDRCEKLSCGLFPSLAAARACDYGGVMLSVAASPVVDGRAAELALREVQIEGVLSDRCRAPTADGTITVCSDRAPDFTPTRLVKIGSRAPATPE